MFIYCTSWHPSSTEIYIRQGFDERKNNLQSQVKCTECRHKTGGQLWFGNMNLSILKQSNIYYLLFYCTCWPPSSTEIYIRQGFDERKNNLQSQGKCTECRRKTGCQLWF